jgi:flagellar basal-body rod protein FlgC
MVDLVNSMHISASGMRAQTERLKVIAQNVANADSTGQYPGDEPYRRKTILFENVLDKEMSMDKVKVKKIDRDKSAFPVVYRPGHPAADENGYLQLPNVQTMVEMVDMQEAQRSYEANLQMIDVSKNMLATTIGMINR